MKPTLRAFARPHERNQNEISAPQRRSSPPAQGAPWIHECRNGRVVRGSHGETVSQVSVGGGQTRDGIPCVDVRGNEPGSEGRSYNQHRAGVRGCQVDRREDRVGQRVTAGGAFATAIPNTLTQSADPFDIVPSAWRSERPPKPAPTVSPDLFELAGIRAAEHWLKIRPTERPNPWCRSTFENLVAGLGRIPSYTDCLAAFERSFKRRIAAAQRTNRDAMEVRA